MQPKAGLWAGIEFGCSICAEVRLLVLSCEMADVKLAKEWIDAKIVSGGLTSVDKAKQHSVKRLWNI